MILFPVLLLLFSIGTLCSKRPNNYPSHDSEDPNKRIRLLEEDTIQESEVKLIQKIFHVGILDNTKISELETFKTLHIFKIFKENEVIKGGFYNLLISNLGVIKLEEFTDALPRLVGSDVFALIFPWDKLNAHFGFATSYTAFSALADCYIVNSKRFSEENNPQNKFRFLKASYHSLCSMLIMSKATETPSYNMMNISLITMKQFISAPFYEFLKKHFYLHPSFRLTYDDNPNFVDECKTDILRLEGEFDRFIARAFVIRYQKIKNCMLPHLRNKSDVDLRNLMGSSLYADFSLLNIASPNESVRNLNFDNVLEVPDIATFHIAVPISIYSSREGNDDDLVLSPLFWEVVQFIGKTKYHMKEICSLNFLPALHHVTPQIIETALLDDFSSCIPQLPDNIFKESNISFMCPSNLHSLRFGHFFNYRVVHLVNLEWSYFNEEIKEGIKSSDIRLSLLKDNIVISPANHGFFADFSILPLLEKNPTNYFSIRKNIAHLPANIVEEVKIYEMSHGEVVNVYNKFANGELNFVQWRENAMRLAKYFNSIILPKESFFEWENPQVPEEYYKFNIENIYGFEELFERVPKGVWMAFFGFIKMEDALWNNLFVLGNENFELHLEMICRLSVDPVFTPIFPWDRLTQSSPKLMSLAVGILSSINFSRQCMAGLLSRIMSGYTIFIINPNTCAFAQPLLKISNDWNSNPTANSKLSKDQFLAIDDKSPAMINRYLLKGFYFDGAATRITPLPEVYFRCANGAALMLAAILPYTNLKWCEDASPMASKVYKNFWNLIANDNIGDMIMGHIEKFDLTDLLRRAIEHSDCMLESNRWLTVRAIPLFHNICLRADGIISIKSPEIARALPPIFFAENKVLLSPQAIGALDVKKLKSMRSSLATLDWSHFDPQTRQSLLTDMQFVLDNFSKNFTNLSPQNRNYFSADVFSVLLPSCPNKSVLEILKSFEKFPNQVLENATINYVRGNISKFYNLLLGSFELESPAVRALLSEPVDEKVLDKTWKLKWSGTFLDNIFRLSKEYPMSHIDGMIQKYIFNGQNFKIFLRFPWNRDILTETEWNRLSNKEFMTIASNMKKTSDIKKQGFISNCMRYFHIMNDEMKKEAVNFLVWSLFNLKIRTILTTEQWALMPDICEYISAKKDVGRVLAANFTKMTTIQQEEIENFLLKNVKKLLSWIIEAVKQDGSCPLFSEKFWTNKSIIDEIKKYFGSGRYGFFEKTYLATGLHFQCVHSNGSTCKLIRELAAENPSVLSVLIKSEKGIIVEKEIWDSISENNFKKLLEILFTNNPNAENAITELSTKRVIYRDVMFLNYDNMTAAQQAKIKRIRLYLWKKLYNDAIMRFK